jgi:hypothetical protein
MKISEMVGTTSGKKAVDQFEFGRFIANNSAASTCFTLGWMTNESADKSAMHSHVKLACFVRKVAVQWAIFARIRKTSFRYKAQLHRVRHFFFKI